MNGEYSTTSFDQFISKYSSSRDKDLEEIKKFFASFDKKMKMYHDNNYIITSFRLQDIIVYEAFEDSQRTYDVNFKSYCEKDRTNITVQKNIFYSACLAVGVYNNCLSYINPEKPQFLKNNFYLFAENIPSDVVGYYRGVIENNADVYLSEFLEVSNQQKIDQLQREFSDLEKKEEELKAKERRSKIEYTTRTNDTWGTNSDAAFSSIALFPILFSILGIIISVLFGLFY